MAAATDGMLNFQLTENEVVALMEVLNFAVSASAILANIESQRGSPQGAAKMNKTSIEATQLLDLIARYAIIGEPQLGRLN